MAPRGVFSYALALAAAMTLLMAAVTARPRDFSHNFDRDDVISMLFEDRFPGFVSETRMTKRAPFYQQCSVGLDFWGSLCCRSPIHGASCDCFGESWMRLAYC